MIISCVLALLALDLPKTSHVFEYVATKELTSVAVAGTFNSWNSSAFLLRSQSDGRTWRGTMNLAPGRHQYKYVLNGSEWITDPKAKSEPDGNGNTNSILVLFPPDYKTPAVKGDGKVTPSAVTHSQMVPHINLDRGRLSLQLTVRPGDVQRLSVVYGSKRSSMALLSRDEVVETYRVSIPWTRTAQLRYAFELVDGSKTYTFGPNGLVSGRSTARFVLDPKTFKPVVVPNWVEKSVFYQIFPDRFDNGDKRNDPPGVVPWSAEPTWYNRFGGDAAGVSKRLGYLKSLGVNAVYFNPIMAAPSNHRYDPVDFYKVDPEFGTNAEFASLTRSLSRSGINVVLDQIFDHVGTTFAPFVDLLEKQQDSVYKDWFFVKSWPVSVKNNPPYEAWFGYESMPKVNLKNSGVHEYLMDSVDFWHRTAKLKGWRLDVANEVPTWFWKDFRKRVKGIDPNAWIVGETWGNATTWLQGDQWDASMNYPFRDALVRFLARKETTPTQFVTNLMNVYGWYAPQVSRNQLNLISSHDTSRFITEAGGDPKKQKLAAIVQFTWVGAPSVYYGEELGMLGGRDPENRRAMRWDLATSSNDMLKLYKKLVSLRTKSPALQSGDPVALKCFDELDVAAFGRKLDSDAAVVAVNRSAATRTVKLPVSGPMGLPRGAKFVDALTGARVSADSGGSLTLTLKPFSSAVLLAATPSNVRLVQSTGRRPLTYPSLSKKNATRLGRPHAQ